MKVIQTKYKGYNFRSRLEARWAVFFDSLNIKWEYEKEGYHFKDGTNYLPDFWLPEVKMWAEVKGKIFNFEEIRKAKNLVNGSHFPVLMLIGIPELKAYEALCLDIDIDLLTGKKSEETGYYQNGDFIRFPGNNLIKEFYFDNFVLSNYHNYPKTEERFYSNPSEEDFKENFEDTIKATIKSKEARFEFGGK